MNSEQMFNICQLLRKRFLHTMHESHVFAGVNSYYVWNLKHIPEGFYHWHDLCGQRPLAYLLCNPISRHIFTKNR